MSAVIHHGECLEVLRGLPDASVHSLVTDPPAGVSLMGLEWDSERGGADAWIAWMSERARECLRVIRPGGHALVWALPRTSHWTARAWELAGWEVRDRLSHLQGNGFPKSHHLGKAIDRELGAERPVIGTRVKHDIRRGLIGMGGSVYVRHDTAPGSPEAERWEGWGTALKPSCEDWWLLRAPLAERNLARNVLTHGTGALNVEACRVANPDGPPSGRWPTNMLLSHAPACQEGDCDPQCPVPLLEEQGGPGVSRFYPTFRYVPKATKRDRDRGLEEMPPVVKRRGNRDGLDYADAIEVSKNGHPTVKPLELMTWLVALVTPPGGTVLDPFAGSGTTGVAATLGGFHFVGIERDPTWADLAHRRIAGVRDRKDRPPPAPEDPVVPRQTPPDRRPHPRGLLHFQEAPHA